MILENLTVVMSVYKGDDPKLFKNAVDSVLNQTQKAKYIIIVADGPIGAGLDKVLVSLSSKSSIKIIKLASNKGLAVARKLAISHAKTDLIAVMDSDDVCVEDRFECQILELSGSKTEVVGGWIAEFKTFPGDQNIIRKTPLDYEEIYRFGKFRNPINHVTLMFKKSSYDSIGGYTELLANEDWELVSRMLVNGIIVRNIPKVLVHVRGGDIMIKRRRTARQFWGELKVFRLMYKCNYLNLIQFLTNVSLRSVIRILPLNFTAFLYKNILRKKLN